jgi:hypothetical protein
VRTSEPEAQVKAAEPKALGPVLVPLNRLNTAACAAESAATCAICRCAYRCEASIASPTPPNKNKLNATNTMMIACPASGFRLLASGFLILTPDS